jgi:hypothetical protein
MKYRIVAAIAIGLAITSLVAISASNTSSAQGPTLIGAFGKASSPAGDLYVHVLAEVPANSNAADVAAAAIAAQGARPITAEEFSLTGMVWTGTEGQDVNPGDGIPQIGLAYNSANEPANGARIEFADALAGWSNITPNFSLADAGTTNRCPSLVRECDGPQVNDGNNDFGWLSIRDRNTLAVTWYNTSTREADVAMNTRMKWFIDSGSGYDIMTVALHELGHVSGLSHSDVDGAVMEAYYGGVRQSPTADDIAGIIAIYGAGPTPTPTPTATPDPNATATPVPTATATPAAASSVEVAGVSYKTSGAKGKDLVVTVAAESGGSPASGASVSITLDLLSPGSGSWVGSSTTGSDGTVSFRLRNAPSGEYRTTVETITLGSLTCDSTCPDVTYYTKP